MKARKLFAAALVVSLGLLATNYMFAQQADPPTNPVRGANCPYFVDENGDGINDNIGTMHRGWNGQGAAGRQMHGNRQGAMDGTGPRNLGSGDFGTCPHYGDQSNAGLQGSGSGLHRGNGPHGTMNGGGNR